jgi:hypothetical protein
MNPNSKVVLVVQVSPFLVVETVASHHRCDTAGTLS